MIDQNKCIFKVNHIAFYQSMSHVLCSKSVILLSIFNHSKLRFWSDWSWHDCPIQPPKSLISYCLTRHNTLVSFRVGTLLLLFEPCCTVMFKNLFWCCFSCCVRAGSAFGFHFLLEKIGFYPKWSVWVKNIHLRWRAAYVNVSVCTPALPIRHFTHPISLISIDDTAVYI